MLPVAYQKKILDLHHAGCTATEIAIETGINRSTVRHVIVRGQVKKSKLGRIVVVKKQNVDFAEFNKPHKVALCERCGRLIAIPCLACFLELGHRCDCKECLPQC